MSVSTIIFGNEEENKAQTSRMIRDRKISSRRTRSSKGGKVAKDEISNNYFLFF